MKNSALLPCEYTRGRLRGSSPPHAGELLRAQARQALWHAVMETRLRQAKPATEAAGSQGHYDLPQRPKAQPAVKHGYNSKGVGSGRQHNGRRAKRAASAAQAAR